MNAANPGPAMFAPADSQLLVIDVQERFAPAIAGLGEDQPVGRNLAILARAAAACGVPATLSEQVPAKLGPTLPWLSAALPGAPVLAKQTFSAAADTALAARLAAHGGAVVLGGVEAHVCVLATVADLRAAGRTVVVAADAVASRREVHRDLALAAARDLGALCLPVESIVFRWLGTAAHPAFKTVSALVR